MNMLCRFIEFQNHFIFIVLFLLRSIVDRLDRAYFNMQSDRVCRLLGEGIVDFRGMTRP